MRLLSTTCIIIGWLLVNGYFLLHNGIGTTGEAAKYISQAQILVDTGHLESPNLIFYSVIIILLAGCIKYNMAFGLIVAVQSGFALAATVYFHRTALQLLRSQGAALIATFVLILNFPYQAFNTFLQTESLFQSLSLFIICRLVRQNAWSPLFMLKLILSLLLLSVVRPTGLLYWPLAGIYVLTFALAKRSTATKLITASVAALLILCTINFAMGTGGELDFTLPFRNEHIICGLPTLLSPRAIPTTSPGSSLLTLFDYIIHNPGRFLRLTGLKTLSFWGVYRGWYSLPHNLYLIAYFYPIILLAFCSLPSWKRNGLLMPFIYLATPVLMTWLSVVFTCDDWSNRFFLSVTPFLILLGAQAYPRLTPGLNRTFFLKKKDS